MNEDKLKTYFDKVQPDISSDDYFLDRLNFGITAIDIVKKQNQIIHKSNRIATFVAAITGFIFGVIFSILYPYFRNIMSDVIIKVPQLANWINEYGNILISSFSCFAVAVVTFIAYEITLRLIRPTLNDKIKFRKTSNTLFS